MGFRLFSPSTRGQQGEDRALVYLQQQGLQLVMRNYRCKGGEIDLVMRTRDGTLVFVEVRVRADFAFGGAAASVTLRKQHRLILAARHYLATLSQLPACRFDVVAIDGATLHWLQQAFDAIE